MRVPHQTAPDRRTIPSRRLLVKGSMQCAPQRDCSGPQGLVVLVIRLPPHSAPRAVQWPRGILDSLGLPIPSQLRCRAGPRASRIPAVRHGGLLEGRTDLAHIEVVQPRLPRAVGVRRGLEHFGREAIAFGAQSRLFGGQHALEVIFVAQVRQKLRREGLCRCLLRGLDRDCPAGCSSTPDRIVQQRHRPQRRSPRHYDTQGEARQHERKPGPPNAQRHAR